MTLEGTINPMRQHQAYREIENLPVAERRAKLREHGFRARVLSEEKMLPRSKDAIRMMNNYETIWVMDESLSYVEELLRAQLLAAAVPLSGGSHWGSETRDSLQAALDWARCSSITSTSAARGPPPQAGRSEGSSRRSTPNLSPSGLPHRAPGKEREAWRGGETEGF